MSVKRFREAVNSGDVLAAIIALHIIPDINATHELFDWGTPLCYVTDNCTSVILIQTLLDQGAKVDVPDAMMWTPLHYAAKWEEEEICQLLLEAGASVHVLDTDMWTPLHAASYSSCLEVAKLLLDRGADINAKTYSNLTPLHFLIRFSSSPEIEVIQEFIQAGANLDVQDIHGYTPLMMAAEQGHLDVCSILLKNGADTRLKNKDGRTALAIATTESTTNALNNTNHTSIVDILSKV